MSGCPFGGRSRGSQDSDTSPRPLQEPNRDSGASAGKGAAGGGSLPTGRARIRLLYEEYVHLPLLREVWEHPTTERPVLEPMFAAAFHGIELAFLLLAEFIRDGRRYVSKRPRVELVADDIAEQCQMLTEVVDAELEEELEAPDGHMGAGGAGASSAPTSRLSLTQPFPFDGCPPTKPGPCHSPGLQRLTDAITASWQRMTCAERNSVIKLVLNITAAFSSFQRWSVGLGIEHQLNGLRQAVGLPPMQHSHRLNLDYDTLVQPWRCEQTLTCENYLHPEDFFFRSIHLGTDCWAFVALSRLHSAHQLAAAGSWHVAAARATQASRILHYLGSHVLLLTSMNLRDYLHLKVELEGTSGEGSVQVKSFRPTVTQLLQPLVAAVLGADGVCLSAPADSSSGGRGGEEEGRSGGSGGSGGDEAEVRRVFQEQRLQEALMRVYEFPDKQPGLYNYCKALEGLETGLLGGFYYRHYCLATNVIGSEARGTMKRAVQALKSGYETPVFPLLDKCRVALGARIDAEVAHNKGRMMEEIMRKLQLRSTGTGSRDGSTSGSGSGRGSGSGAANGAGAGSRDGSTSGRGVSSSGGCPFAFSSQVQPAVGAAVPSGVQSTSPARPEPSAVPASTAPAAVTSPGSGAAAAAAYGCFEAARRQLYSWQLVPPGFRQVVGAELAQQVQLLGLARRQAKGSTGGAAAGTGSAGAEVDLTGPLSFLDHAWGQLAPLAQYRAWREAAALYQLGNPTWDVLFGRVMPQAAAHIKTLLGLPAGEDACTVQFGSNSHELVGRLLSAFMHRPPAPAGGHAGPQAMRVLTSDTEFYSIARQLNRFVEADLAEVDVVPAEPAATFPERCCSAVAEAAAAGRQYSVVYLSQTTYLTQQTLIPSIPALVRGLRAAAAVKTPTAAAGGIATHLTGEQQEQENQRAQQDQCQVPPEQVEQPLLVIDGYHGFCALPTDLGEVAQDCCYVAGLLKHAGCGANCAFLTIPTRLGVRPVLTGWLADPSVLAPGSAGIQIGSEVGYCAELALQGGTPAYLLPLLTFNHLMQLWHEAKPAAISVAALHQHVTGLHRHFLDRLDAAGHPDINTATLLLPQDPACRSHTLVFRQADAEAAKAAVEGLARQGVLVDCRKAFVRFGFGSNHSMADVDALLATLTAAVFGCRGRTLSEPPPDVTFCSLHTCV